MVVRGDALDVMALPIRIDGNREGFVAFRLEPQAEIVLLQSLHQRAGIGTALVRDVIAIARERGARSLMVTTTNDNSVALAFYQENGFKIRNVYPGAVDRARLVKPSIPKTNAAGVPISDEIELALQL